MAFKELDIVVLVEDYPIFNLKKGTVGVIVHVYRKIENKQPYEIEFFEEDGATKGVFTLLQKYLKKRNIKKQKEIKDYTLNRLKMIKD